MKISKDAWKELTFSQKVGYIKDYYWFPICLGVVLLVAGIFFLTDAMRDRAETVLHVTVVESKLGEAEQTAIIRELSEYLELDPKKEEVMVEVDLSGTENMSSSATVGAYILSGRTDIIICSEEKFSAYAVAGYFVPWEEEELALEKDRYFYAVKREYDGGAITEIVNDPHDDQAEGAKIYGVYMDTDSKDWVVGMLTNAPNQENAVESMDYFIKLNNLLN